MRQLCIESSCPYSGRSVRHGGLFPDRIDNQSGHWSTKPWRIGLLLPDANEQDSKRQREAAHLGAIPDVIGQKSAEAIVAGRFQRDFR